MFHSILEIKEANRALGHHWFDPATTRFFRSRICPTIYAGRYFITSEQYDTGYPRLYTIHCANSDGSIDTVGSFQQFPTRAAAVRHLNNVIIPADRIRERRWWSLGTDQ